MSSPSSTLHPPHIYTPALRAWWTASIRYMVDPEPTPPPPELVIAACWIDASQSFGEVIRCLHHYQSGRFIRATFISPRITVIPIPILSTAASPRIFEWTGVGAITSKPTYLPAIFCFSSVLGHFIWLTHRLHNFSCFFKKVTSPRGAGFRAFAIAWHDER